MELPPFLLERWFARHEFSARHLLCASDCETMSIADLLALEPGAREELLSLRLGYTESAGAPSLRRDIAALYGALGPDEVLVHAGAEEAIFLFMHAALAAGDEVIVHVPCYPSLADVARSIGCTVRPWPAREERGWAPDVNELRRLVTPRTRVIVINTPHNPTGWLATAAELREVAALAEERGIVLFSDEVYRGLEQDPGARLPAACDLSPSAVSLGVLSKTWGLPGLRIGWAASRNAALLRRMAELKDYTTICASAPSELLAGVALRHAEEIAARSRAVIGANLALLDGFFHRRPDLFAWQRPAAGPVAFPRLRAGGAERFCADLVSRAGVLLAPGAAFESDDTHVRVGFGRRSLPGALAALDEALGA